MGELRQRRGKSSASAPAALRAGAPSAAPPVEKFRMIQIAVCVLLYVPFLACFNPITAVYFFRRMTHRTCQGKCAVDNATSGDGGMCPELDTDRLVFLRIPKTASTSVKLLFQKIGRTKSVNIVNLNENEGLVTSLPAPGNPKVSSQMGYHDPKTQRTDRRKYYQSAAQRIVVPPYQGTDRYLYEGHLHYVDWANAASTLLAGSRPSWHDRVPLFMKAWYGIEYTGHWGLEDVRTVAMLRHPFERLASVYYYDRSIARSPSWRHDLVHMRGNLTLEECLIDEKCVVKNELRRFCSIQTEILCGIGGTDCRPPKLGEQGLERAKANIREGRVAFVGVTERMGESNQVLEKMFPTYLEGVNELEVPMERENRAARRENQYTNSANAVLEEICKVDLQLYEFVDQLLTERVRACSVK